MRFYQDVIELNPSTVVILAGINDIAENTGPITIDAIFENIVLIVDLAKAKKIKVILCSILPANYFYWNPKSKPADKIIVLNNFIKSYANENKIPYADYFSAMVDENKGLEKKYGKDGVHPNLKEYELMEKLVMEVLFK